MPAVPAVARAHPIAGPSPRLLATIALTVFCATLAGAGISWIRGALLPVWLGTAIVVYWLLHTPRRDWPSIVVVCWLANVAAAVAIGRGMPRAILLPTVNLIQAFLVAAPLRVFKLDEDFARPRTLCAFYALILGPASIVSALIGAFVVHGLAGAPFLNAWAVQLRRATATVSAQAGTGLGLALVRALAEKHGGRLIIESESGRGTCATIEIPLRLPAIAHASAKSAA